MADSNKKQKTTAAAAAVAAEPSSNKIVCTGCQKKKLTPAFPCDQLSRNHPMCITCFVESIAFAKSLPRHNCQVCGISKSKNQYNTSEWSLPSLSGRMVNNNSTQQKTTVQIIDIAKQALELEQQRNNKILMTCQSCSRIRQRRKEERELRQREKERARKESMKQHGVLFYDYNNPIPHLQYSPTKPAIEDLSGTYDILFHHGWNVGQDIENRTTKGTVTITTADEEGPATDEEEEEEEASEDGLVLSGKVEFLPCMRNPDNVLFQNDFYLSKGRSTSQSYYYMNRNSKKVKYWSCTFRARMCEEEAIEIVHEMSDVYDCSATMKCVAQRAAIPWIKHEGWKSSECNAEVGETVPAFNTLEEAETIAREYENSGPSGIIDATNSWLVNHKKLELDVAKRIHEYIWYRPKKPVFFIEPGDFILQVDWSDDYREQVTTECILRKRKDERLM